MAVSPDWFEFVNQPSRPISELQADIDGDGEVAFSDFLQLSSKFGKKAGQASQYLSRSLVDGLLRRYAQPNSETICSQIELT